MCDGCYRLIAELLNPGGISLDKSGRDLTRGPLKDREKVEWVLENLPKTSAVLDLDGFFRKAERQPA